MVAATARRCRSKSRVQGAMQGAAGHSAVPESAERTRASRRSCWTAREGDGSTVAAVVVSGGDEPVRVGERERSRGGDEHGGEWERV